ncbi:hypothetical protein Enr13x_49100 [Stieleria neptunia]|uniref:Putative zinc-finger domain-containing protein n=1 Tax=Stieleria neptunia TaxID=2527979 RepID=A0A518HW51_9BACT|nr:zf-HC2 domain-containing protein [Stieleria neptunia]QDV45037.1 hypothetical protein Enr13x_49100 [Stieleria neptunia]
MMSCEQTRSLLGPLMDQELTDEQADAVRGHLSQCGACHRDWESLNALDTQLRSALRLEGVEQAVAAIESPARHFVACPTGHRTRRSTWVVVGLATAVCLLVAAFVVRNRVPWTLDDGVPFRPATNSPIVATLIRATGTVQVQHPGSSAWNSINHSDATPIAKGSRLRTQATVLCELQTSDQGKIRLNEAGEVVLHDTTEIELVKGQIWCLAPEDREIEIDFALRQKTTPIIASMACPSSSEFQCSVENYVASCDSNSLRNPPAQMTVGANGYAVQPGETVSVDVEQNVERKPTSDSPSKVWQLPLLAIGDPIDRELVDALSELLAPIGKTKAMHLNETQIRRLGPAGAIPLLAYAATETAPQQLPLRRTAVSLARDLADARSKEWLAKLAADPDPFLSNQAVKTLERIAAEER